MPRLAGAVVAALVGTAAGMDLTKENWAEETAGKTVFVKFYASWCGHCKAMKPAWDQLMQEYEGHATTLVADVECSGEGQSMCEEVGVEGFPTIKYGDPDNLEDYDGGREYEDLKAFADGLGPMCSPKNIDLCPEDKRKQLEEYLAMTPEAREKLIQEKTDQIEKLEEEFKTLLEGLQKTYEEADAKKTKGIAEIKASGLGLLKSANAHVQKGGSQEL